MNKMKRVFSLVLAFAIVLGTFGSFAPVFAAEAKTETKALREVPKDVIGTEYEDAVRRLVAFGIIGGYPDGTYKPEDIVNRAQFAKIIVEALGLKDAVGAAAHSSTGFSDVYDGHWATGYINVASGQGLITGYPDGTFKAEQDVTYAEALTMLVRALGYRDEFLQGQWPGNYISKAADAGITRGVNIPVNAQVGAQRGYIANLVNNALDAKVVKVDKYTQGRVDYYETDIPLLKDKLEISKYEDTRIIADKIVEDGLAKDELRLRFLKNTPGFEKKDRYDRGEIVKEVYGAGANETFRFDDSVNPRETIGEEVTTYINDRDVVIYVERENDDKAHFDFVEKVKGNKLDLVKFDREYDFETSTRDNEADLAVVYNFNVKDKRYDVVDSRDDLEKLDKEELVGRVGKFVVKNNRIVYAEILDPAEVNEEWLLVRKNDKGLLEGVSDQTEDFRIDLRKDKDYDNSIAFNTKGEKVDIEDIEAGNIIYVQEQKYDGDDYALVTVVQDNKVEGEAGRVKTDRIEIAGKEIKVVKSKSNDEEVFHTYYTVDDYDEVKEWKKASAWEDDMEDAYKQDVVAFTDAVGRIAFLKVGGGNSGYKFGIVTRTYADGDRVRIYTTIDGKEGKDQVFKADKERDIDSPKSAVEGVSIKGQSLLGSAVKFRLNSNGEIADGKFFVMPHSELYAMTDDFGKDVIKAKKIDWDGVGVDDKSETDRTFVVTSDNITVVSAEGVQALDTETSQGNLDGHKYEGSTKVDIDDFNVSTWKDIKEDKFDKDIKFFVFTRESKKSEVDGLVFVGKDGANTGSDEVAVYVLDKWRAGDDVKVEYVTYPANKKEVRVIDEDGDSLVANKIKKEKAYVGKEKSNGKLSIVGKEEGRTKDFEIYRDAVIEKISGNYIKVKSEDKDFYISGALIYDEDKSKTSSFLSVGDKIDIVTEGIRARVIGFRGAGDSNKPSSKEDKVTYINEEEGLIEVNDKVLELDKRVRLLSADGETMAIGPVEVAKKLTRGDLVKVTSDKGIVTEIKLVKEDTEEPEEPETPEEGKVEYIDAKGDSLTGKIIVELKTEGKVNFDELKLELNGKVVEYVLEETGSKAEVMIDSALGKNVLKINYEGKLIGEFEDIIF